MSAVTVTLTPRERLDLTRANRILTRLTERHHHACEGMLCEARMLTDVQDCPKDGWTVPGVTLAGLEDVNQSNDPAARATARRAGTSPACRVSTLRVTK